MKVYKTFIIRLVFNYLIGSLVAVAGVGGLMVLTTLSLSSKELLWLLTVLVISAAVMITAETLVFIRHVKPIREVFDQERTSWDRLEIIYKHVHRLPGLAVKRIMIPHFIGMALPAIVLTLWFLKLGKFSFPAYYIFFAFLGALLIASMHAIIEFYLTCYAIRPIIGKLHEYSRRNYGRDISLEGQVIISIRRKFRWSAFLIGVFPLLLYSLVVQFKMGGWTNGDNTYWQWAGYVLIVGLLFSYMGAWMLTREVERPIQHLYEVMAKVKAGNLQTHASDLFSDEFSKLVSGFNHMLQSIKEQDARNNQLIESYFSTLAAALDARDPYTAGHSQRVAEYAIHIGMLANLPEATMEQLRKSALLHDIGKIGTRDAVLLKDGKLTEEEFGQIKQHPVQGENILRQIEPSDAIAPILPGVRSHHERYDGKGYPDALRAEDIPLFGRIIAVADAFDAMTSSRPYRQGMDTDTAIRILEEGRGTQWDPYFAGLFVEDYKRKKGGVSS
ncbi:hypothetical protein DCC85_02725 [Paenibacillus sp. CAA11]|uniref:HD domain-containing phosphohydrolase n=1 Tax=Paenibacillus sp. CAA11 TaxID=1532905 RepID=UPI000D370D32|nr:HD domain-containing phosphohydrolase [Paenibacillus sp. CAA11]AWB43250.1 hypothetical protein DCC85_02725 [Paenibacillus sp. CAA11]